MWTDPREYLTQTWFLYDLYSTPNDSNSTIIGYSYSNSDYIYGSVDDAINRAKSLWPDADGWEITDRLAEHTIKHIFKVEETA